MMYGLANGCFLPISSSSINGGSATIGFPDWSKRFCGVSFPRSSRNKRAASSRIPLLAGELVQLNEISHIANIACFTVVAVNVFNGIGDLRIERLLHQRVTRRFVREQYEIQSLWYRNRRHHLTAT